MSPRTGSRRYTHTHLKWFLGTSVYSTFPLQDFSFFIFYFFFLCVHKKHKNSNKRISYFFPLRCFLSAFLIFARLFAFLYFLVFFGDFWSFLLIFGALWCVQNPFVKKSKKVKTALITSFILLLSVSALQRLHCNRSTQFTRIIKISIYDYKSLS